MTAEGEIPGELVPDPSDLPPLYDPAEFTDLVNGMVTDHAPRVFAVVEEYGNRVDAKVVGWGLAYDDHADVIGVHGAVHLGVAAPDKVLTRFGWGDRLTAHIVWPAVP